MPTIRVVISGRVQGVGFRYYANRTAYAMGISGEVWNRPDGRVELVAGHADRAALDEFVSHLQRGPGLVDSVLVLEEELDLSDGFRTLD